VFGLEFTNSHLRRYLEEPIDLHVGCIKSRKSLSVRMRIGLGSDKAIITSGWQDAVNMYNLREDDIVIFRFHPCQNGGMSLMIMHVDP
jgi:hypothetical protein